MPQEFLSIHERSESSLREERIDTLLEGRAFFLTAVTTLVGLVVSCVIASNAEGDDTKLAAETAAVVSIAAAVSTSVLALEEGYHVLEINKELSSRKSNS